MKIRISGKKTDIEKVMKLAGDSGITGRIFENADKVTARAYFEVRTKDLCSAIEIFNHITAE